MPIDVIDYRPAERQAAGTVLRRDGPSCDCRVRALQALGELADLAQALGIDDPAVWRGLSLLETRLTGEPRADHAHWLGNVH